MNGIATLANPLWQSMCLFAFAYLCFSWVQAHKDKIAVFDSARYIVFLLALLATISFSRTLFVTGTTLINTEAEQVSSAIEIFLDNAGRTSVEGESSNFAVAAPIMGVFLDMAHFFASLIREVLGYFQWGVIYLLYSVSPLLIAFLAHPSTKNVGVRFITTSFGVMMWKFGFVFADMIFLGAYNEIVKEYIVATSDLPLQYFAVVSGLTNVALSLSLAAWLFIMLCILGIMYFLSPLIVYLIFSGASPAGAVGAALGSAVGGAAAFSRLSSSLSSSRKGLSSSLGGGSPSGGGLPASPLGALSSLGSKAPMMGLSAGEVSQRENKK